MRKTVVMLARAMHLERWAVLGHSYGAFVALQQAVDYPGSAAAVIVAAVFRLRGSSPSASTRACARSSPLTCATRWPRRSRASPRCRRPRNSRT